MPRVDAFRGGAGVGRCLLDTAADHHISRAHLKPCRRRPVVRTRRASPTVRRAALARPDQRCPTDGGSGLSASRTPARTDFTRSAPPRPSAAGCRAVEDLADDRLGQPARVQPGMPLRVGRQLVRDEPAERPRIEVFRTPGRQPQARLVVAGRPPRSASPPVSFVDHRVPPDRVSCQTSCRAARAGRSLSERRREPVLGYIRFVASTRLRLRASRDPARDMPDVLGVTR
jgi:hypothetical protein